MTRGAHSPTSVLRFVERNGRYLLQQWWGLQAPDLDHRWHATNEGYWEDIPSGPETPGVPEMAAHYRPVSE